MTKSSQTSILAKIIAASRYGNKLVTQFNFEKGGFKNGYTKTYLDENRLYQQFREGMSFSIKDFNPVNLIVFFKRFFYNIIAIFLFFFWLPWLVVYSVVYFFRQTIFVFKNIGKYAKEDTELVFYGKMHYWLSAIVSPVSFFIYLVCIEHGERELSSFGTLFGRTIVVLVKVVIQAVEITWLPIGGLLFVLWIAIKGVIKFIQNNSKPFFKPVHIKIGS